MHTIFHIHPSPDRVVDSVIRRLFSDLFIGNENGTNLSVCKMSRFLFVLGQTALCCVVYTENIANRAKKCSPKEPATNAEHDKSGVPSMEDEMGMAAAADADHERLLNHTTEYGLVIENLLGRFKSLLEFVVANGKGKFSHPLLRESSVLAMCRYMSTSMIACEQHLPLLFTVLGKENSLPIKTTIMIALGDLAFRFPNSVEPWTDRMYSR